MKSTVFLLLIAALFSGYCVVSWNGEGKTGGLAIADIRVDNLNISSDENCISCDSIKRDEYVLGIQYFDSDTKQLPYLSCYQDKVITQKIYCNTNLDEAHPAGSDVTKLFSNFASKKYEGAKLALKCAPRAGMHSFKVCIYRADGSLIEKNTASIKFY